MLGVGLVVCGLSACAGLRVSAHRLIRISILVQLALCAQMVLVALMRGYAAGLGTVVQTMSIVEKTAALSVVLNLLNMLLITRATIKRAEYPWSALKWTFLVATLLFAAAHFARLAALSAFSTILAPLLGYYILPPVLQVVLLWWPRKAV